MCYWQTLLGHVTHQEHSKHAPKRPPLIHTPVLQALWDPHIMILNFMRFHLKTEYISDIIWIWKIHKAHNDCQAFFSHCMQLHYKSATGCKWKKKSVRIRPFGCLVMPSCFGEKKRKVHVWNVCMCECVCVRICAFTSWLIGLWSFTVWVPTHPLTSGLW